MSQTMTNGDSSSQFIDVRILLRPSTKIPLLLTLPLLHRDLHWQRLHLRASRLTANVFLQHLTSYPAVSDSITYFKQNPYGKKSLDLSQTGYEKFVSPFVPYAKRPYGYVAPYVHKVDSIGSNILGTVDQKFPIMKEDTEKIKGTVMDYAYTPFRLVGDGKNYLMDTYSSEYKKCGGDGYVAGGKAFITSGLVITSDTFAWLGNFLGQKKEEGADFASKKYGQASHIANEKYGQASHIANEKYGQASQFANEKSGAAMKYAEEMSEQAKQYAYEKKEDAKDMAGKAQNTASAKADEAKKTAKDKTNN